MKKIIEFKNVRKEFLNGSIIANDDISFFIKSGEVHALAGENGAGKSTLLSMLFGLYKPTNGEILINGKNANYNSAFDAIKDGMGMVYQHFQLIEKFTVAENVILGNEKYSLGPKKVLALRQELRKLQIKKKALLGVKAKTRINDIQKILQTSRTSVNGFLNRKKINEEINKLSQKYNFNIKAKNKISSLTVGQQQKVEILKLLYKKSDILIFDEPTAMLTPQEIDKLLQSILEFKKQGKTIIIITHKLDEIKKVADRVTVLRKGRFVGTRDVAKITASELGKMMVGFDITKPHLSKGKFGKEVVSIKNLTVKKNRINKLDNISFSIRSGEIVAIAGVEGNGQTELAHAISGLNKNYQGQIWINNLSLEKLTIKKRNKLLSNIPEDRHKFGVIVELKTYENAVLKNLNKYSNFGFLNRTKMLMDAHAIINNYDVRGSDHGNALTSGLSGGNQQKLVIGRELVANRSFVLSFQATRGLDIGAINYVHNQLIKQRSQGKAILLISYDLNEILQLADKVIVFNQGKITGILQDKAIQARTIGKFMTVQGKRSS